MQELQGSAAPASCCQAYPLLFQLSQQWILSVFFHSPMLSMFLLLLLCCLLYVPALLCVLHLFYLDLTVGTTVKVCALDAAQPFDFEHRMQNKLSKDKQLKIGIVGFGTFGQFLARRMIEAGHRWVTC